MSPLLPIPLAQWTLGLAAVAPAIAVFKATNRNWVVLTLWSLAVVTVWVASGMSIRLELVILAVPIATAALICKARTEMHWPYFLGKLALPVYVLHSGVASVTRLGNSVPEILGVVIVSTLLGALLYKIPVFRPYV